MIKEFESIIQSSVLLDERPQKIIFIGDTLADRGHNDYFTLIIFQRIYQQIEYSILLSNHDIVHLCETEGNDYIAQYPEQTHENYFISFLNFKKLTTKFADLQSSATEMLNTSFKPFIKIFEFGFPNDSTMLLFSHTPFIFNDYFFQQHLFNQTNLNQLFVELEHLNAKIIDSIAKNQLHLIDANILFAAEHREFPSNLDNQFLQQNQIINIHGHVGARHNHLLLSQSINLDSDLGRTKTNITPEIYQADFYYNCHQSSFQHQQQKLLSSLNPSPEQDLREHYISKILELIDQLEEWASLDQDSPQMLKLLDDLSKHSNLTDLYLLVAILNDYGLLDNYVDEAMDCQNPCYVYKTIYLLIECFESDEHLLKVDITNLFRHQEPKIILSIFYLLSKHHFITEELDTIEQFFEYSNLIRLEQILNIYLQHQLLSDHELLNELLKKSSNFTFIQINNILISKDCLNNRQKKFIHQMLCTEVAQLDIIHQHLYHLRTKNLLTNALLELIPALEFFNMPVLQHLIKLMPYNSQQHAIFSIQHLYPIFKKEQEKISRFQWVNYEQNTLREEDWKQIFKKPEKLLTLLELKLATTSKSTCRNRFFSDIQTESVDSLSIKKPKFNQAQQSKTLNMEKNST
jgi:hypothetical protein